jgi:protein ImuB
MQAWDSAAQVRTVPTPLSPGEQRTATPMAHHHAPQPSWILPHPLRLPLGQDGTSLREHPLYHGPLKLLAGPHRIEAGWWDGGTGHARVTRDYYLASSAQAGLLWIFKAQQQSPDDARSPWFLHGFFA